MDKNHFILNSSKSRKFLNADGVNPDEAYLSKINNNNNNNNNNNSSNNNSNSNSNNSNSNSNNNSSNNNNSTSNSNNNKEKKSRKQATRSKSSKSINTDHFSRNGSRSSSSLISSVSSDKLLPIRDNDSSNNNNNNTSIRIGDDNNDDNDYGSHSCIICCPKGIKTENIIRLFNVVGAFPFVIVVASLNLSSKYETFLRSVLVIRTMNILMLFLPYFLVKNILAELIDKPNVQILVIAAYIAIYLFPVAFVIFTKFSSSSLTNIVEGTFCFKPSRTARLTWANLFAIVGFVGEWLQHIAYVLPLGIVTNRAARLSDYPPFHIPFQYIFWTSVVCAIACGLVLVLNAVLRGKAKYYFQKSYIIWLFVYFAGSPLYVTIITIFCMGLSCDSTSFPPVLYQNPSIVCYSEEHIPIAIASLVSIAVYIVQNTLLPSGTFKETMNDNELEIMFVPVYLQAHSLFKAMFCFIYVFFYNNDFVKVTGLTIINLLLFFLNNFTKPCSITWVNEMRDVFFLHASLAGIQSLNYLAWPANYSTKSMVISTLASNVLFITITMYVYFAFTTRSTEYAIAKSFLDLEWQVSRGGSVHPRVLEPLISLTLSTDPKDWEIAKKFIGQLVWLISYPNMRVQFQSSWGLANLASLEEDARIQIHNSGGTKSLFEWYSDMDFFVQLETLAALTNLTLSFVVADEMVKKYKCIPFFLVLISSNKTKHSQFAAIAIGNLARKQSSRDIIISLGGIQVLLGCINSHDYLKKKFGCLALANVALSGSNDFYQVFSSEELLHRIIRMAIRNELETQIEVIALLRNLSCFEQLRPLLLNQGIIQGLADAQYSIYPDVITWYNEIILLMNDELLLNKEKINLKSSVVRVEFSNKDKVLLNKFSPLCAMVQWDTWGSKLETIFSPIFSVIPNLESTQKYTFMDLPLPINLSKSAPNHSLKKWRDSLTYEIVGKPIHGKLSDTTTTKDIIIYTPLPGYIGHDFFTFQLLLGSLRTSPCTVTITISKPTADGDIELGSIFEEEPVKRNSFLFGMKRSSAPY